VSEDVLAELKRYVRFDAECGEALRALAPFVLPERERIADEFYARIREHEDARRIFADDAQIERQKARLIEWLDLLVRGPWDGAYAELRSRIGRKHVEIALPQRYMFGATAVIRKSLAAIAEEAFQDDEPLRLRVRRALDLALDLELALMLESYAEAHAAQIQKAAELESELERERLAERTRRAETLASLGAMAAGLAHEVRNPLNAAQLQLEVLVRKLQRPTGPDVGCAKSAANLVADELHRLARLVDDVLEFARPRPLRLSKTDLRETAAVVVELAAPEASERGVKVTLAAPTRVRASADEERVKQVLHNLVRNAVEACEGGKGSTVVVAAFEDGAGAVLEVRDDGPGLQDADAPIFEPFFTTKHAGTGLGLSLVRRIVSDHDGVVTCESAPGRTVFRVVLPR
jgi:two-component system, NtrC family, sensor histidine kinase HydH